MASGNNYGISFPTGKISFPLTLASVTGPGGFGDSLSVTYSTSGLLNQVKTWNEETPTTTLGLGWVLNQSSIYRVGDGSLSDKFYFGGGSDFPLLVLSNDLEDDGSGSLTFTTQAKSLSSITYTPSTETWVVIDSKGIISTYGGKDSSGNYDDSVELGVRWVAPTASPQGVQQMIWIGSSTETSQQSNYALVWNLVSKETRSGQKITYKYSNQKQNVGRRGSGLSYTMACYLEGMKVEGGDSLTLVYNEKEFWEYPSIRTMDNNQTNAYQDRIEKKYLQEVEIYGVDGTLQGKSTLGYAFMYDNFSDDFKKDKEYLYLKMNKRVLTSISNFTSEGVLKAPALNLDYWGLTDEALISQIEVDASGIQLKCVSSQTLSLANIANPDYPDETYNALFGHLKTMQSASGSMAWYSYSNNSVTQQGSWDLTLDFQGIIAPDQLGPENPGDPLNWENPTPYWGPDGYVVLVWNSTSVYSKANNNNKYIALTIYEWQGKWLPMNLHGIGNIIPLPSKTSMIFQVDDFSDGYVNFQTSTGRFMLARANLPESNAGGGTVTIFHRDAYIPQQWNMTFFTPQTCNTEGYNPGNSLPVYPYGDPAGNKDGSPDDWPYVQLSMSFGTNIAALLDSISGVLSLYSLVDNEWIAYPPNPNGIPFYSGSFGGTAMQVITGSYASNRFYTLNYTSGMTIVNNDVFLMTSVTDYADNNRCNGYPLECNTSYQIYHYDVTQSSAENAWLPPTPNTPWKDVVSDFSDINGNLSTWYSVIGILCNNMGNTPFVQIILGDSAMKGDWTLGRPIIVSWDETRTNVNIQQIYSPNNASEYKKTVFWGSDLEQTTGFLRNKNYGVVNVSNLINISTASGSPRKYVARYVGGDQVGEKSNDPTLGLVNTGWICDGDLNNLKDNSDEWEQMATTDTTVAISKDILAHKKEEIISGIGNLRVKDYGYIFYQFNPYGTEISNPNLSPVSPFLRWVAQYIIMGSNQDWQAVEDIIDKVFIIDDLLKIICLATGNPEFNILINLQKYLIKRFTRNTIRNALSGRREGLDLGNNYLIVGTQNVGDNKLGQPHFYYKSWNIVDNTWTWIDADPQRLLDNLTNMKIPIPYEDYAYPVQNSGNRLMGDIYQYGNSFIPFSYGLDGADKHDYESLYYHRAVYAGQVGFFRNGILSSCKTMPSFTPQEPQYPPYGGNPFSGPLPDKMPYLIHQPPGENWILCAPWGGILGYQPELYLDNSGFHGKANPWADVAMQGATGLSNWNPTSQDASSQGAGLNPNVPTPTVQQAYDLALFMAQNEALEGNIEDYVVDKISIDDGYQVNSVNFQYSPNGALYQQELNCVVYNQINIAAGASTYQEAEDANGRIEKYYYNGGTGYDYRGFLPFDPSTDDSNPYFDEGLPYTNAQQYLLPLTGKLYCQRVINNQGYEMNRQYSYSAYYEQAVGIQICGGVAPTLTVTITAPQDTKQNGIQDGIYVVTTSNSYYDINNSNMGVDFAGNNELTGQNTGLTLSTQQASNHYTPGGNYLSQITQTQYMYGFQVSHYQQDFIAQNLWSPIAKQIVSQTLDSSPNDLHIVSATATNYKSQTSSISKLSYWSPYGSYRWAGSDNGVMSISIPWMATNEQELLSVGPDWQLGSYASKIKNGIVYNSVNVSSTIQLSKSDPQVAGGTRSLTLYDKNYMFPIAQFSSPNATFSDLDGAWYISDSVFNFTSFEPYENLSQWGVANSEGDPVGGLTNYITQDTCYAGSHCLKPLNDGGYVYFETPTPSFYYTDNLLLSLFLAPSFTSEQDTSCQILLRAGFTKNGQKVYKDLSHESYTISNPIAYQWNYAEILIPLKKLLKDNGITERPTLWIGFSWESEGKSLQGYIDCVSLMPLSASGTFTVYDSNTWLAKAAIGSNGSTTRYAYDNRQNVIGTTQGRGDTQDLVSGGALYYSRQGNNNQFSPDGLDPNSALSFQLKTPGKYFDFRTQGDLMGWEGDNIIAKNGALGCTYSRGAAQYPIDTKTLKSIGLRAQIEASNIAEAGIGLDFLNSDPAQRIIADVDTDNKVFLKYGGVSQSYPLGEIIPSDWFLVVFETGEILLYINGKLIFNEKFPNLKFSENSQARLYAATVTTYFKDIMILKDPLLSTTFADGSKKTRQVQSFLDIWNEPKTHLVFKEDYSVQVSDNESQGYGLPALTENFEAVGLKAGYKYNASTYRYEYSGYSFYTISSKGVKKDASPSSFEETYYPRITVDGQATQLLNEDKGWICGSLMSSKELMTSKEQIKFYDLESNFPPHVRKDNSVLGIFSSYDYLPIYISYPLSEKRPKLFQDTFMLGFPPIAPLSVNLQKDNEVAYISNNPFNKFIVTKLDAPENYEFFPIPDNETPSYMQIMLEDGRILAITRSTDELYEGMYKSRYKLYILPSNFNETNSVKSIELPEQVSGNPTYFEGNVFIPLANGELLIVEIGDEELSKVDENTPRINFGANFLLGTPIITKNNNIYIVGGNDINQLGIYICDSKRKTYKIDRTFPPIKAKALKFEFSKEDPTNLDINTYIIQPSDTNGTNFNYSNFTVEFWMKPDPTPTMNEWVPIIGKCVSENGEPVSDYPFYIDYSAQEEGISIRARSHAPDYGIELIGTVSYAEANNFFQIAFTKSFKIDSGTSTFLLSVNGMMYDIMGNIPTSDTFENKCDITIGCLQDTNGNVTNGYNGAITEVRIWNYARNLGQIQQTKSLSLPRQQGLMAYWPLTPELTFPGTGNGFCNTELISSLISQTGFGKTRWSSSGPGLQKLQINVVEKEKEEFLTVWDGQNLTGIQVKQEFVIDNQGE